MGDLLRLVYYDHRGNGCSGRPPTDAITLDRLCADADALRALLGFERIALLGLSFGEVIALESALRYPDRLSHVILVGTAPAFDHDEEVEANARHLGAAPHRLARR
ncbi:MAG: alpha/beta hydrolase [Chloroflexota bacterium]|nr:alpha/beta hydrolase [Chloroflexota bacterium]